jgi:hypothetical protein
VTNAKYEGPQMDAVAYQRGATDAQADIAAKACRLFWQTRGAWGELFTLMHRRFGVKVVHTSDLTSTPELSYHQGYNDTIKFHLEHEFGANSFDCAWNEVREYRVESYKRWSESKTSPSEDRPKD